LTGFSGCYNGFQGDGSENVEIRKQLDAIAMEDPMISRASWTMQFPAVIDRDAMLQL
jgi:hypothetical protein